MVRWIAAACRRLPPLLFVVSPRFVWLNACCVFAAALARFCARQSLGCALMRCCSAWQCRRLRQVTRQRGDVNTSQKQARLTSLRGIWASTAVHAARRQARGLGLQPLACLALQPGGLRAAYSDLHTCPSRKACGLPSSDLIRQILVRESTRAGAPRLRACLCAVSIPGASRTTCSVASARKRGVAAGGAGGPTHSPQPLPPP